MQIVLPQDVIDYIFQIFKQSNDYVSYKLSNIPQTWETSLDMALIERLSQNSVAAKLPSNWKVRIDAHFLGGRRHWGNWEIADIGILIIYREQGKIFRIKVALFQSKRLYPLLEPFNEETREHYLIGFSTLLKPNERYLQEVHQRILTFSESSKYTSFIHDDEQYNMMKNFQKRSKIPVYYLLYNPLEIPFSREIPITSQLKITDNKIGCRIVPLKQVEKILKVKETGYAPSYGDFKKFLKPPFTIDENIAGWRLENFIVNELITCREGYRTSDMNDDNLMSVFTRKSGPFAAIIAITIDGDKIIFDENNDKQ